MISQICFNDGGSMGGLRGIFWPSDSIDRVACVLQAYFDESWDQHQKKILVIACMFGRYEEWRKIEWPWKDLLSKYDLKYYRASEAEFARGEFDKEPFRTKDLPTTPEQYRLLQEIRAEFFEVITRGHVFGLAFGVPLELFYQVADTPEKLDRFGGTPYYHCATDVLLRLVIALKETVRLKELVAFVFDRQKEFEAEMVRLHGMMCDPDFPLHHQMGSITFADKKTFIPLQVTDTLGYEVRKDFERKMADPNATEREEFRRLKAEHKIIEIVLENRNQLEDYLTDWTPSS
jgi:hypothetical protein